MQAIVTKYLPPTNHKGARVVAKAAAGRLVVHWDHSLNVADNHAAAARALVEKLGWGGRWIAGGLPSEDGDVFVAYDQPAFETEWSS